MYGQVNFGSMTGAETILFLKGLLNEFDGLITVVFDNGRNVRCAEVKSFVDTEERIEVIYLPPYAPDCNPIELLWGWIRHYLGSLVFSGVDALLDWWKEAWFEVVKLPDLVKSFFKGSRVKELSL
jgi:putative transposase